MSGLRSVARTMASETSYRLTKSRRRAFRRIFEDYWYVKKGHPMCLRKDHTKKHCKGRVKRGDPMRPMLKIDKKPAKL